MRQVITSSALVAVVVMVWLQPLRGEEPSTALILANHPVLVASLERIARGSELFRTAVAEARTTGRRALVLTPDAVVVVDPEDDGIAQPFDSTQLAEVAVVPGDGTEISAVLVVVNLPLFEEVSDRRGLSRAQRDADLDRILIHEVYGHALPYLIAGDRSGRCPDPALDQRADDACSIQRENAVRAELGLGRRTDYGLQSLALTQAAKPWRHAGARRP